MKWYGIVLIVIALMVIIFLLVAFYFLKTGNKKKVWDFQWLAKNPIAHRGYHLNDEKVPENSSIAFLRAIERNYTIEIDLNLTKDHKVVVFHDGTLARMCNDNHKVIEKTMEEISRMKLKNGEYSPMELTEFLTLVDGRTGILIEFKGEGKEIDRILCEESMKILKNYHGKWVMQSFQPSILKWFRKHYPMVPRGQLCHRYVLTKEERKNKEGTENENHSQLIRWMFTNMCANFIGRPNFISREWSSINRIVKLLHKMNVMLLVWTVNTKQAYQQVHKKVDNVIFEYLELDENGNLKQ